MEKPNFETCKLCIIHHYENEFDIIFDHVNYLITQEMFDDENYINILFQRIIRHCLRIVKKTNFISKKELLKQYREKKIHHSIFERLIMETTNGETCISCPSRALSSCAYNCAFCPTASKDGTMIIAKSYTSDQNVFKHLLENKNNFVKYLLQHLLKLHLNGVNISKCAMRHLGGTFHSYEELYRYEFSRDIFYCMNIISDILNDTKLLELSKKCLRDEFDPDNCIISCLRKPFYVFEYNIEDIHDKNIELGRIKKSLKQEQEYNVNASNKVVSYSIETRPDQILTKVKLEELLQLGVTIVELGLQSPLNEILDIVQRGHSAEISIKAIATLKNNGFHVHGQWMMDLPGSSKELEMKAIKEILSSKFRCDQIKIYPHLAMPDTLTKKWLDDGIYKSWVENDWDGFIEVVSHLVSGVGKTTRIVRIQRDLPQKSDKYPDGYTNNQPSDLEQIITKYIYTTGQTREDIHFHEPKNRFVNMKQLKYYVSIEERSDGQDIFISAESNTIINFETQEKRRIIWGYCRLALINNFNIKQIDFLKTKRFAMIRELKVNSNIVSVGEQIKVSGQHSGIGSTMLKMAEKIAREKGYEYITVTASVGTRGYYEKKHGYILDECGLMWKVNKINKNYYFVIILVNIIVFSLFYFFVVL